MRASSRASAKNASDRIAVHRVTKPEHSQEWLCHGKNEGYAIHRIFR
jgi:hypothetical protein